MGQALSICVCIHTYMTKTISLADDAYEALNAAKRPGESFSVLARRLARDDARVDLLDPQAGIDMTDDEARAVKQRIYAERDASTEPRHG